MMDKLVTSAKEIFICQPQYSVFDLCLLNFIFHLMTKKTSHLWITQSSKNILYVINIKYLGIENILTGWEG